MTEKPRVVLVTDSLDPSGMGEHMLALGRALSEGWDVTLCLAGGDKPGLLRRAAHHGLGLRSVTGPEELRSWLSTESVDLVHVHAGIGWEGHEVSAAAMAAG
ncbi:MAG: hypothetical protein EOP21_04040, partial [Hyphomicrobiales bacterium]